MAGGKGKITGADGKPFVKGDPRINKEGRPLKLPDLDNLLVEVLGEEINGKQAIKQMLIALRKKALSGDIRANEILIDRKFGKVKNVTDFSLNIELLSDAELDLIINRILNTNQK